MIRKCWFKGKKKWIIRCILTFEYSGVNFKAIFTKVFVVIIFYSMMIYAINCSIPFTCLKSKK